MDQIRRGAAVQSLTGVTLDHRPLKPDWGTVNDYLLSGKVPEFQGGEPFLGAMERAVICTENPATGDPELQLQRAPAALDVRPELRGAGEGDEEGLQSLVNQESEFVREGSQEFSDAALSDLGSLSSGDDSDGSLIDPEQGDIDFHPHFIQLVTGYGRIHKPGEGVLADKPACNAVGKRFTRLVLDEDWGTGYDLCERWFWKSPRMQTAVRL